MTTNEHTLQEFLSDSVAVISDLDDGEIVLHQDDGDDLVLMTRARRERLALASQVAMLFARGDVTSVESALYWFDYLERDRDLCLAELAEGAEQVARTGDLAGFAELLYEWESTGLGAWDRALVAGRPEYAAEEPLLLERPTLA